MPFYDYRCDADDCLVTEEILARDYRRRADEEKPCGADGCEGTLRHMPVPTGTRLIQHYTLERWMEREMGHRRDITPPPLKDAAAGIREYPGKDE